jgi:hypothetical protein
MTTLLDKQRSTAGNIQGPDEATLDRVLSKQGCVRKLVAATRGAGPSRRGQHAAVHPRHYATAGAAVLARLS